MPSNQEPRGEHEKSRNVRAMFSSIAGRYDFLNHFLSANLDRRWRRTCVQEMRKRTKIPFPKILDVGCGTADLSIAFSELGPVFGCDFCHPMLCLGAKKTLGNRGAHPVTLLEADALVLPFSNSTFDIVVSAFVLRNLADMNQGFQEMKRVLRPGGIMGVLDFGMPRLPLVAQAYKFYFLKVLPRLGKLLSGVEGPYGYLPTSVQAFPPAEELKQKAGQAGFANVEYRRLTAGVAVLLIGTRPD